uniref:Uncharacterized protein n=1 Tax=viral metagenome TaxID=1070528 RepID=A0A6M3XAD1_9ZZZZ
MKTGFEVISEEMGKLYTLWLNYREILKTERPCYYPTRVGAYSTDGLSVRYEE